MTTRPSFAVGFPAGLIWVSLYGWLWCLTSANWTPHLVPVMTHTPLSASSRIGAAIPCSSLHEGPMEVRCWRRGALTAKNKDLEVFVFHWRSTSEHREMDKKRNDICLVGRDALDRMTVFRLWE